MVKSYRDKKTKQFAEGKFVNAFSGIEKQAIKRLAILNAATSLDDLHAFRSNHLESLIGTRNGQFSIRINIQWRVCLNGLQIIQDQAMLKLPITTKEKS